ncbi:Hypothetical protein A7982_03361 [Minicystis rosea]|nr:Hypothetical protein A7982_03361 [Minicystis rosea]
MRFPRGAPRTARVRSGDRRHLMGALHRHASPVGDSGCPPSARLRT